LALNKASCSDARTRILEAAGEIFSEDGFKRATVRKICFRAGVNVSLVNYHFGDKEGLYLAVLGHFRAKALEKYPPDLKVDASSDPEDRLAAFLRSFLFRILGKGQPSWFGKLLAREFIEPTKAFDVVVEEVIRPSYKLLMSIVSEIVGKDADERIKKLCTASIIGQCLYYHNSRAVISRIMGKDHFSATEIEDITVHIKRFSLGAMRSCYGGGEQDIPKVTQHTAESRKTKMRQRRSGEVHGRERAG
jgi:TetR/AcrR family transcriptional regulator, regulator of cefoperazone and chloramphenicol sensitivity